MHCKQPIACGDSSAKHLPSRKLLTYQCAHPIVNTKATTTDCRWEVRINFTGIASWYGYDGSGSQTASGERYNPEGLTAAHRTLPFGTKVRVTNTRNGRSVVVRINDRGPYIRGRIIDVSAGAARILGMIGSGVAPVNIEVLGR